MTTGLGQGDADGMAPVTPIVNRLAVIGLGLIGGSVALAARARRVARHVIGYAAGNDPEQALSIGLVDEAAASIEKAVANADLVVLAVPVPVFGEVLARVVPALSDGAIITDCCSTKVTVVREARAQLGARWGDFVPGHPIAGSELSGPTAGRVDLFVGKRWLLAPDADQQRAAARARAFAEALGAVVSSVDAVEHDSLFAEYSHMPHALVFALCRAMADGPYADRLADLAGAGFRDTSRIGASAPALWTDILLDNHALVIDSLQRVRAALDTFEASLVDGDREAVRAQITAASLWRAALDGR